MNTGRDILLGIAVGDALGVPVEFVDRAVLKSKPVTGMMEYGTHRQPKGTWSDDSSLSFCLAESLASKGYELVDIAQKIIDWFHDGIWTAHGKVFDIGGQTRNAIDELTAILRYNDLEALKDRSNTNEYANGNGGLMRILPLAFEALDLPMEEKFRVIKEVTALTHGHIRSVIANLIYILLAEYLMEGIDKDKAYLSVKTQIRDYFECFTIPKQEQQRFMRILDFDIASFEETEIRSDGYVVHSLEAAIWSFLRNDNYETSVLTAVNLGGDTDTIAAITGGLAGITYGEGGIPKPWKEALVGRKKIEALGDRLFYRYYEE